MFAQRSLVKNSCSEIVTLFTVLQKGLGLTCGLNVLNQTAWPIPIIFRKRLVAERARPKRPQSRWRGPIPAWTTRSSSPVPEPAGPPRPSSCHRSSSSWPQGTAFEQVQEAWDWLLVARRQCQASRYLGYCSFMITCDYLFTCGPIFLRKNIFLTLDHFFNGIIYI